MRKNECFDFVQNTCRSGYRGLYIDLSKPTPQPYERNDSG